MIDPFLLILIERLLWPIPRVRWEAARSMAQLIREENKEAANALLGWINARQLESEAVLGLCVIDGFDLGSLFEFADVSKSVRAPSLLSDLILKKNFSDADGLSPTRYARSPSKSAELTQHEKAWFNRYRETAVPRLFTYELTRLQKSTGFSFMMGWEYDWRWLQASNPRPEVEHPHFFTSVNRKQVSHFNCGQRELYVSAYLRTLAIAAMTGAITYDAAEFYAMYALTMNRGLAELETVERPEWARHLLPCDTEGTKELARKLWASAEDSVRPGEVLLATRVVESEDDSFIEFDMTLAIGPSGFTKGPAEAETLDLLMLNERPGEMAGLVGQKEGFAPLPIEHPLCMTQGIFPEALGSVHYDMALNIRLASPAIFNTAASVRCGPSEIRLEAGTEVLSRWVHWYADWEPIATGDLGSTVCSVTTVLKSNLDHLRTSYGADIGRLVRVRRATRRDINLEHEAKAEAFWI